jgi:hypothetical protein
LNSKSSKRGQPFPSPVYSSSSSERSFPLFKFEKYFEIVRKIIEIIKKL